MVRSGATYEACPGRHIVSQGGAYQYDSAAWSRTATRSSTSSRSSTPTRGSPATSALRVGEQPPRRPGDSATPVGPGGAVPAGPSSALDRHGPVAAARPPAEYGLPRATSDVRRAGPLAARRPRVAVGPPAGRRTATRSRCAGRTAATTRGRPATGRTSRPVRGADRVPARSPRSSPTSPAAAPAGRPARDRAFAAELRAGRRRDLAATRAAWTGRLVLARLRGRHGQLGTGVIFGEPQPWAMLAGALTPRAGGPARRAASGAS